MQCRLPWTEDTGRAVAVLLALDGVAARTTSEGLVEETVKVGEGVERRSEGERHWRCVRSSEDGLCVFEVQIG